MLILDRYLIRSFIKGFFACLFVFILLYMVIDIFSSLPEFIRNHPPTIKIVEYYLYSVPIIFSQTAPMASLLATLFTLGNFNQNNEIIAMRSNGLSVFHIIRPLIVFGIILSLGIFLINETITPQAQKMSAFIKENYINKSPETVVTEQPIENVAVYGLNNRLYFINKLYPKNNTIEGLTILEHDSQQNVKSKIYAEKAVWRNNRWVLYQCFIYHMEEGKKVGIEQLYFTDTPFKIEESPQDFFRQNVAVENMNAKELSNYISRLKESGDTPAVKKLQVDLYQKTSFPFTSLVIILLGIPSSVVIRRRAMAFSSIGLCIGISFLFYTLFAVSIALGKAEVLHPLLAAWLSHIIVGSAAVYFITRIP